MKEKEWNRQRDALSAERRKLPMVRIEKDYVFEGLREMPGLSVFLRDGDRLFHTYSTYTRGLDQFLNTYNFLDHTPLGRQEDGRPMSWLRHHDKISCGGEFHGQS